MAKKQTKRTYDNSLRQQQQQMTKEAIRKAAEQLILEGQTHFTIQEVANKAGVSYGTVYRHFESREALIEGLINWSDERAPSYPTKLEDIPNWVREAIPLYTDKLPVVKAMESILADMYSKQVPASTIERDELFLKLVSEAVPELTDTDRKIYTANLRLLVNMRTWADLYTRLKLNEEELVSAVSEGVIAVINQMKKRGEELKKLQR
ncbi:MAG: TetR/AcrR family transcriptional regulator [Bacillaceae bacterium]|nr:TetR/AcrR family transcriptional regulator [Bacillaceae bacterium]